MNVFLYKMSYRNIAYSESDSLHVPICGTTNKLTVMLKLCNFSQIAIFGAYILKADSRVTRLIG